MAKSYGVYEYRPLLSRKFFRDTIHKVERSMGNTPGNKKELPSQTVLSSKYFCS
ncbi:hypothetical protein C900_00197 [Fulvivirga imtechensis AK7]|uniref:Uncharacterized protein n=1 Tax=Fulvivirga imtechensis AK7 TaxID=1237149 RepID=L8JM68_9BACT|nr:hypothetical protein C900_00197 [Fulvivirga imtechensis AK7]